MEEIKPLPLWSNIFGLVPFPVRGKNPKWHKTIQRCLFLWCCIVFVLQLAEFGAVLYILLSETWAKFGTGELTGLLTLIANQISVLLANFLPRFICLRSNHFKASLDQLQSFIALAGKQVRSSPSIRKRVILGFIAGSVWFVADFGITLSFVTAGSEDEGKKVLYYLVLFTRCISYGHQIFAYVSLYVIAHLLAQRITIIQEQFQRSFHSAGLELNLPEVSPQQCFVLRKSRSLYGTGRKKTLQKDLIRKLVDRVHWAGEELVHTFSPIILVMLILKLVVIITMLIQVVAWMLHVINSTQPIFNYAGVAYMFLQLVINILLILIVFHVADIPVQKMSALRRTVADYDAADLTLEEKTDLNMLLQRISPERVQLTAGGLFGLGKHLLPAITGTIVTYIVILMQAGGTQWKS